MYGSLRWKEMQNDARHPPRASTPHREGATRHHFLTTSFPHFRSWKKKFEIVLFVRKFCFTLTNCSTHSYSVQADNDV